MSLLDRAVSLAIPAVPKSIVRHFSKRYIAGPRIEDAVECVRGLAREGAMATVDILGEFIHRHEEARNNTEAYLELLARIHGEGLKDTNISVKLSALGLLLDEALCLENMRRILAAVRDENNFVRIDMEDSHCTSSTIEIYRKLRSEFGPHTGLVLQSRLRRTLDDVDQLADAKANYRLCKGIYIEPRPIAYTDPELIRRNFVLVLARMLELGCYVGIATHDERVVWEALRLIREHGLTRDQYEFQMLLGVDESLRRILIAAGHRLRVYVPYGEQWYAYSVRRLRENPQLAGYAFKAVLQRG